ncbi:MAG: hypothetical protein ACK53Y_04470, partial [bacterium]
LLLLHELIYQKRSDPVILAVLNRNHDVTKFEKNSNSFIQTPITFAAIEQGCSDEVLLATLNANCNAAKETYCSNRLLLRCVME